MPNEFVLSLMSYLQVVCLFAAIRWCPFRSGGKTASSPFLDSREGARNSRKVE